MFPSGNPLHAGRVRPMPCTSPDSYRWVAFAVHARRARQTDQASLIGEDDPRIAEAKIRCRVQTMLARTTVSRPSRAKIVIQAESPGTVLQWRTWRGPWEWSIALPSP